MSVEKRLLGVSVVCFVMAGVLFAALVFLMTGCDGNGPTPSPSPLPTPMYALPPVDSPSEGEHIPIKEVSGLEIGGFEVVFIVMGVVQLVKLFGVESRKAKLALAVVVGLALNGVSLALAGELIPPEVSLWVLLAVRAVGYTLAIPGLYDLVKDEFLPAVGRVSLQGPPRGA